MKLREPFTGIFLLIFIIMIGAGTGGAKNSCKGTDTAAGCEQTTQKEKEAE